MIGSIYIQYTNLNMFGGENWRISFLATQKETKK